MSELFKTGACRAAAGKTCLFRFFKLFRKNETFHNAVFYNVKKVEKPMFKVEKNVDKLSPF